MRDMMCYVINYETETEINQQFKIHADNQTDALDTFFYEVIMGEGPDGEDREDIDIISILETDEPYIGMTFTFDGDDYEIINIDGDDVEAELDSRHPVTFMFTLDEIRECA